MLVMIARSSELEVAEQQIPTCKTPTHAHRIWIAIQPYQLPPIDNALIDFQNTLLEHHGITACAVYQKETVQQIAIN